jgi:hypothetical protein
LLTGLKNLGLNSALVLDTHLAMIMGTLLFLFVPLVGISMVAMNYIGSHEKAIQTLSEKEDVAPNKFSTALDTSKDPNQPQYSSEPLHAPKTNTLDSNGPNPQPPHTLSSFNSDYTVKF